MWYARSDQAWVVFEHADVHPGYGPEHHEHSFEVSASHSFETLASYIVKASVPALRRAECPNSQAIDSLSIVRKEPT